MWAVRLFQRSKQLPFNLLLLLHIACSKTITIWLLPNFHSICSTKSETTCDSIKREFFSAKIELAKFKSKNLTGTKKWLIKPEAEKKTTGLQIIFRTCRTKCPEKFMFWQAWSIFVGHCKITGHVNGALCRDKYNHTCLITLYLWQLFTCTRVINVN